MEGKKEKIANICILELENPNTMIIYKIKFFKLKPKLKNKKNNIYIAYSRGKFYNKFLYNRLNDNIAYYFNHGVFQWLRNGVVFRENNQAPHQILS